MEFSLATHDENVFRNLPDFLKEIIMASDEWKQAPAEPSDNDGFDGSNEPADENLVF